MLCVGVCVCLLCLCLLLFVLFSSVLKYTLFDRCVVCLCAAFAALVSGLSALVIVFRIERSAESSHTYRVCSRLQYTCIALCDAMRTFPSSIPHTSSNFDTGIDARFPYIYIATTFALYRAVMGSKINTLFGRGFQLELVDSGARACLGFGVSHTCESLYIPIPVSTRFSEPCSKGRCVGQVPGRKIWLAGFDRALPPRPQNLCNDDNDDAG